MTEVWDVPLWKRSAFLTVSHHKTNVAIFSRKCFVTVESN